MASIRQNAYPDRLPDWRNLGVIARTLIAVNALLLAHVLADGRDVSGIVERFARSALAVEPLLIGSIVVLLALSGGLARLPYWGGFAAVVAIVAFLAMAEELASSALLREEPVQVARKALLAAGVTAAVLGYLRLVAKAYSPALSEARLQALQARIRPHFLFNSLNAVLGLIRRDPKRAERALEDLAELFRSLMSDGRQFVRLADEITLLERYADLEQLRLGERLRITWEIDTAPSDALLPPLLLQPLLENAVYHGVEPGTGTSDVLVRIALHGERIAVTIENPYTETQLQRGGNRMALENIRERLMLFFDAEARLETAADGMRYRVNIELPYRTGSAP
jgi:two-component system, LytTR family, sensor histidine kinase AlgZ